MKTQINILFALLILSPLIAFGARQTSHPLENGQISFKNDSFQVTGILGSKVKTVKLDRIAIEGKVGIRNCGADTCSGKLQVDTTGDVFLIAQLDEDRDGVIDFQQTVHIGTLKADRSLEILVPTVYLLIKDHHSLLERLAGARDQEYLVVKVRL